MTDPYIIKEAKPGWSKRRLIATIAGSTAAGALIIGGTAFGLSQLDESHQGDEIANEEIEQFNPGEGHEDGEGGFGEGFGEDGESHSERGNRPDEDH